MMLFTTRCTAADEMITFFYVQLSSRMFDRISFPLFQPYALRPVATHSTQFFLSTFYNRETTYVCGGGTNGFFIPRNFKNYEKIYVLKNSAFGQTFSY